MLRQMPRLDPVLAPAALALCLVTVTQAAFTGFHAVGQWADALINEWICWFTGLYVALALVRGLVARTHVRAGARRER